MPTILLEGGDPTILTLKNSVPLPAGVSVSIRPVMRQKTFGADHPLASAIITFASGISSQVIATWLWEHFNKHKAKRARINRIEITIDEGAIRKIVQETIDEEG